MKSQISDLFVIPPQFTKEAGFKMPPNSDLWSEAIFQIFSEQYPDLAELSGGDVDWDKTRMDEDSGFGVGVIIVNSNNVIVKIPVVVKDFMLQPIDIFEYDGKMKLLNSENIGAALKEQDSIGDVSVPANTKFTSGEFNQWLTKGASAESWRKKLADFSKIAKTIAGPYADRPIALLEDAKVAMPEESMSVYLKPSGSGVGYVDAIFYSNGEVVKVGEINSASPELNDYEDIRKSFSLAFNSGSAICKLGDIPSSNVGFVGLDATRDLGLIDGPGVYESEKIGDDGLEGVLVAAFNMDSLGENIGSGSDHKMFFVVEGDDVLDYAQQQTAVGKATKSNSFDFSDSIIPLSEAGRYDKGVLIYSDGSNADRCSELVKIDRIEATPRGKIRVFMKTDSGDIHYLINDDFRSVMILSDADPLYSAKYVKNLTGPNLPLLKLGNMVELVSSLDKHQMLYDDSVINAAKEGSQMTVSMFDGKVSGQFNGTAFSDDPEQFMARLVSLGIGPEKTAAILQRFSVDNKSPITIVGIQTGDGVDPEKKAAIYDVVDFIKGMRVDFIKAAAAIEAGSGDEAMAASVLGLGMLDEENIRYFVQLIPNLDDIADSLAKMLYAVRIGNLNVDEGAIKSALLNITKIIGRLREMSNSL